MADMFHRENLSYLCRICSSKLKKEQYHLENISEMVKSAFYIDIKNDKADVHPAKICLNCYAKMKNSQTRNSTLATTFQVSTWEQHSDNCSVCQLVPKIKKGGRPPKKSNKGIGRGRRKSNDLIWNREAITSLQSITPKDVFPHDKLNINNISKIHNPHLRLCVCDICLQIFHSPVILQECQHSFCLNCILPKIEGRRISETVCPSCGSQFSILSPSTNVTAMLRCLQIECIDKCGKTFSVADIEKIPSYCNELKKATSTPAMKVNDILLMDDVSKIPREVEDAALHVIKQKLASSNSGVAEFKSGGPRVSDWS